MVLSTKTIIAAIGTTIVVGAAVLTGVRHADQNNLLDVLSTSQSVDEQVCLVANVAFFDGLGPTCLSASDVADLDREPVLNDARAPVMLQLVHPTDIARAPEKVRNCEIYNEMTSQGWLAESSSDMRREAFFIRACGFLDYLSMAKLPEKTFFKNGECSRDDVLSLSKKGSFAVGEVSENEEAQFIEVTKTPKGWWTVTAASQHMRFQEIAHADFNDDGFGDVLSFMSVGSKSATVKVNMVGILEKKSPDADVTFFSAE